MRKIALGILILFCCVAVKCSVGQTLKFTQIEKTSPVGAGSLVTTNTAGVMVYTASIPYSKITGTPVLTGSFVPYTGATGSVNLGANSLSVGATSTVQSLYVPSTATVNGALLANSTSTFLNNMKVNGILNIYDGGTQTINGGILSQVNGAVLSLGVNTGSSNLFGGSYTQAEQGAVFKVDSRVGNAAFTWNTRAPTVSAAAASTVCMSLTNAGVLTLLPQSGSQFFAKKSASGFIAEFDDNSTHKAMEFYGDNSAHGSILRMYNKTTTNNVQLVGDGSAGQSNFFLTAKTGFGTSSPQATVHCQGTMSVSSTATIIGNTIIGNATGANQEQLRVGQHTATVDIGSLVGATSYAAIYFNTTTPATTNYAITSDGTDMLLNAPTSTGAISLRSANNIRMTVNRNGSGLALTNIDFLVGVNTNQTLSTNIPSFRITGASKQWATGALATQYFNHLTANTVAFVGASTASDVYGLYVNKSVAGTNATITRNWGIGTDGLVSAEGYSASSTSSLNGLQLVSGGYSVTTKIIDATAGDAITIDSPIGQFRKDATGTTFVLTNSQITANSVIMLTPANAAIDVTATSWTISKGAGSATITFNLAPTANFDMMFMIMN